VETDREDSRLHDNDCLEDAVSDILQTIYKSVITANRDEVEANVQHALDQDISPETVLNEGLIAPMEEIGSRFENGEIFVPEMLVAARAMKAGLAKLRPLLADADVEASGKVVIGTVEGDLHDIGKNLVAIMLEGAGFEVFDLGTDVSPEAFAEAVQEHEAQIVGMSALLTTTMENMKLTIEVLEEMGIRQSVGIMIGGAPLTEAFAEKIGADAFAADASRAVAVARALIDRT
jgi:5-methyltetrahydrofolate--homocysteine methyltransferase